MALRPPLLLADEYLLPRHKHPGRDARHEAPGSQPLRFDAKPVARSRNDAGLAGRKCLKAYAGDLIVRFLRADQARLPCNLIELAGRRTWAQCTDVHAVSAHFLAYALGKQQIEPLSRCISPNVWNGLERG